MRIGLVPVVNGQGGGVYQYGLSLMNAIYQNLKQNEAVVFTENPGALSYLGQKKDGWVIEPPHPLTISGLGKRLMRRIYREDRLHEVWDWKQRHRRNRESADFDPDIITYRPERGRWFLDSDIDFMVYPASTVLSFEAGVPFVMSIHDLQHRLQPEFPEVTDEKNGLARDYLFRNAARYATLILSDSEIGREDILNFYSEYGLTEDRVKVLPPLPAPYLNQETQEEDLLNVREKYILPEQYFFLPAHFWPHQNHVRVLEAIRLLKDAHDLFVPIVFCGSSAGQIRGPQKRKIMKAVSDLGLEENVWNLGYVPDEEMPTLYAGAIALVFPTFFGPTNIPIVEAWRAGCPVLSSNIRGVREHVGDAGMLVDPNSVEEIAQGMRQLWTDESLRLRLSDLGKNRDGAYTPEEYSRRLWDLLREAKARVDENVVY